MDSYFHYSGMYTLQQVQYYTVCVQSTFDTKYSPIFTLLLIVIDDTMYLSLFYGLSSSLEE